MPNLAADLPLWSIVMPTLGSAIANPSNPSSGPLWNPEPKVRASLGILTNCLLPLGLCVWTTTHIDYVPPTNWWNAMSLNLYYLIMAMYVPEVMMAVAGS